MFTHLGHVTHQYGHAQLMSPALGNGFGSAHWTGVSLEPADYVSIAMRLVRAILLCRDLMTSYLRS